MRFLGLFFDFPRLQREKRPRNEENSVQQGVPGYGPQLVRYAMAIPRCIGYSYSPWAVA